MCRQLTYVDWMQVDPISSFDYTFGSPMLTLVQYEMNCRGWKLKNLFLQADTFWIVCCPLIR